MFHAPSESDKIFLDHIKHTGSQICILYTDSYVVKRRKGKKNT